MGETESQTGGPEPLCLWCGTEMQSMGPHEFRVGGTSGGWKLLFGEWAELGEGMLNFEVLACPACHRVDFRVAGR